ncbi:MAG: DUF1697 domain-containing protein [Deltaproteobacteria bacterium]|nr:DUF1697 domain-containing protein [Deltaproteobacteria bacterium]
MAHVALLRGINVAGKNRLPMKDLALIFQSAGCRSVRTHIQSGNVVFDAEKRALEALPRQVSNLIREQFGFDSPVIVRSAEQLREVIAHNPFANPHPKSHHVAFLSGQPTEQCVSKLDPNRSPPDRFQARGCEIYLWLPNGVGKSKLTNAYFDRTLEVVSTLRNWRTVLDLAELLR